MENGPQPLTTKEWREIAMIPYVREACGIEDNEAEESFQDNVYAAKFGYLSDGPGYAGDLFVILGGEPECPPVVIKRLEGKLEIVDSKNY